MQSHEGCLCSGHGLMSIMAEDEWTWSDDFGSEKIYRCNLECREGEDNMTKVYTQWSGLH